MSLSIAAKNLYEVASERFPTIQEPPQDIGVKNLKGYEVWFDSVIALYEKGGVADPEKLTGQEERADEKMVESIFEAKEVVRMLEEEARQKRWAMFELDPYGHLSWVVGSGDDFGCFDYDVQGNEVAIVTTLNSETGCFIMETAGEIVSKEEAVNEAIGQVDQVYSWCLDNEIALDEKNYGGWRFVEAVKSAVGNTEDNNPFPAPPNKEVSYD